MIRSRHRRGATARVVVPAALLLAALAAGLVLAGVGSGAVLRVGAAVCLVVASGVGVVALAGRRSSESRAAAAMSRERAARSRETAAITSVLEQMQTRLALAEARIDAMVQVEAARPRARADDATRPTLLLPLLRAAFEPFAPQVVVDVRSDRFPPLVRPDAAVPSFSRPASTAPAAPATSVTHAVMASESDQVLARVVRTIEVVGEFSLDGLTAFPRPAGMPSVFPSESPFSAAAADSGPAEVIDLNERARSTRSA